MSLDHQKLSRADATITGLQKRMGAFESARRIRGDAFNEGDHPRAANGQFGSGGGSPAHEATRNASLRSNSARSMEDHLGAARSHRKAANEHAQIIKAGRKEGGTDVSGNKNARDSHLLASAAHEDAALFHPDFSHGKTKDPNGGKYRAFSERARENAKEAQSHSVSAQK